MEGNSKKRSRKSKLVPRDCLDSDDENIASMQEEIEAALVQIKNKNILKKLSKPPAPKPPQLSVKIEVEELGEAREPENNLNIRIDSVKSLSEPSVQPPAVCSTPSTSTDPNQISDETLRIEIETLSRETTSLADRRIEINVKNFLGKNRKVEPYNYVDEKLQAIFRRRWTAWRNTFPQIRESPMLYKCDKCNKAWWHLYDFREHLLKRHKKKMTIQLQTFCHECHIIAYSGIGPELRDEKPHIESNCWRCGQDLAAHMVSNCEKSAKYRCKGCMEKFYTCTLLYDHRPVCPLYVRLTKTKKPNYPCSQCPTKHSTETQLLTHMVMRHSVRSDLPVDWVLRICTNCNYAFHLQSFHDCPSKPPVASCKFCLQKYNTHSLLNLHVSSNDKQFPCKVCGVMLNQQCMELQHLMEHTDNYTTLYKCIYCTDPIYFPTLYLVNKHKFSMHRGEKESKNLLTCYDMVVVPKRLAARLPGFEQAEKQRVLEPISLTEKSFDSCMERWRLRDGESSSSLMVQDVCTDNLPKKAKYDMKSSSISNVIPKKPVTEIEKPQRSDEEVIIDMTLPESTQDDDVDVEILDDPEENIVIDITELDQDDEIGMKTPEHQQNKDLAHIKTTQEKINNIPESDLKSLIDVKIPLYNQENNSNVELLNNTANSGDENIEERCNDDTIDLTQENNIDDIDMTDNTQERDRFDINMPKKLKENPKKMTTDNIDDVPPTVINQFDPCVVIKKEIIDYSETTDHTQQEPEEMPAIKIENVTRVKEEPSDIIQVKVNILNSNSDTNNTSVNVVNSNNDTNNTSVNVVNSNNDTNNTTDNKALIKHIFIDNMETRHVINKLVEKVNVLNNNSDTNNISNIKTIVKQTVNDNSATGRVNKKLGAKVMKKIKKRRYTKLAAKQTVKGNSASHFDNNKKLIHIHKITKTYTNNKLKREIDIMGAKINSDKLRIDINKKLRANIDNEKLKNNINFIKLETNIDSDKLIKNNENLQANDVENNTNNDKLNANIDTFSDAAENDKLIDNIEELKSDVENDKVKANIETLNNAVANDILQTDYDKLKANNGILRNDGNDQPKTDSGKLKDNIEKLRNDVENDKLKTNNDKQRVTIAEFINDKLADDSNINTDTNMTELVNHIKQEVADTVVYEDFEVGEEVINFKIKEENLDEFMEDDMIILDPNNSVSIKYEIDPVASTSSEDVEMQKSLEPEVIVYQSYGKKLYKCTKCDYMGFHHEYKVHLQQEGHFASKKKHACLRRTKAENGPGYLCTKCDLTYQSSYKYNIHFCKVHGYKPLTCPKCFRRDVSAQAFHSHIHSHIKDSFVNIYVIKTKDQDDARNTHQCKVCSEKVAATDFFKHWESHLEILDVPRKSQNKNKGFSPTMEHKHELKKMLLLLQGLHPPGSPEEIQFTKLRNCVKCNRRFERKNECKRHFIEHLLSDAYAERHKYGYLRCQICSEDFHSTERYKRHMREHGSLPIYKCELCDKAFSDSSNFTKHKKVHNLHVLICDICNKKFTGKAFLERHIIMHQKVKPLVCHECNKVFYTESSYRKHISRGKTRFKCPSCHVFFTTLREKWDHMWEEHKERKVQADCPICKKAFRKHQDVRNHIRVEHKDTHFRYVPNRTVLSDERPIAPKPQPKPDAGSDAEVVVVYMDQGSEVLYSSKAGQLAQDT